MYYWMPLPVASLRQLSASFWPLGSTKTLLHAKCCHSCLGHWDMSLNVNQASSILIRQWISPCFQCGHLQQISRATAEFSGMCRSSEAQWGKSGVYTLCDCQHNAVFFLIHIRTVILESLSGTHFPIDEGTVLWSEDQRSLGKVSRTQCTCMTT